MGQSIPACWFSPTHDGTFLSWERGLGLSLQPGWIVECPDELNQEPYDRSRISLLWSLLGDNASLICVGLTYAGQRLDWPLQSRHFEPLAAWGRFRVDCQADTSLVVEDCVTMFPAQPLAAHCCRRFMVVAVITIWAPVDAPRTEKIGTRCNQGV